MSFNNRPPRVRVSFGNPGTPGLQGVQGAMGIQGPAGGGGSGDGSQGVQGTQGLQGSIGLQGVMGIQGPAGSGTGDGSQGVQGTQGTQGTLGRQGTQGATGAGTQGAQGTSGSQGSTGVQGTQGASGPQGDQGITGSQGIQGTTGSSGEAGSQGTQGTTGSQGTQGTLGTQGASGSQGIQGTQGVQGRQGTSGSQGTTGSQGASGTQGAQGTQGVQGRQGTQGATGLQGANGVQGTQGTLGPQGIQGSAGFSGDLYQTTTTDSLVISVAVKSFNVNTGLAYSVSQPVRIANTSANYMDGVVVSYNSANGRMTANVTSTFGSGTYSSWQVNLAGAAGVKGDQGDQGIQGIQGTSGAQGTQGTLGPQGTTGSQGIQGTVGAQGASGSQGTAGANGSQGTQGTQGVQGRQGTQGATGSSGLQGNTGSQGIQGTTGSQGIQGTLGAQGASGSQGIQGTQGVQGRQGTSGAIGSQGIQGTLGIQGNTGAQGIQGVQGIEGTGTQGVQGTQGPAGPPGSGSGTITVAANTALEFNTTTNVLSTIYNTSIEDTVNSVAVGGAPIANAAVWKTKNIVEVLDTILFPDQLPTYTIPALSFSASITGNREVGESINQSMTSVGTKNDANTFTQIIFRRGGSTIHTNTSLTTASTSNVADQFGYSNPNNPNFTYTGTNTDVYVVTVGSTTWNSIGSYGAGLPKKNNKGVTDTRTPAVRSASAPQAACTSFTSASSGTVTGLYPYFWGITDAGTEPTSAYIKSQIESGTANKVLSSSSGTITINFGTNTDKWIWFAHIASDTTKVYWFNRSDNNGAIGGEGAFIRAPVTQSVNSSLGFWNNQSYKMYSSDYSTNTEGSYEFRNTAP